MELSQYHQANFQQFVQDHLKEDPALLLLKYQDKTDFDLKAAVQQISARQKATKKLPSWASNATLIFPASISLEQSSSELTAVFKSRGKGGNLLLDLTGGFGVDSYFLSTHFGQAIYCEKQEELVAIAQHNLDILAPQKFKIVLGDGLEFLGQSTSNFDLIYADPARRGKGNQKMYKLQDCEPDVVSNWEMMKSKADSVLLKLSPMLDISQALSELPEIQKVQVISVKNDVRELLLHWDRDSISSDVVIEAIDLGLSETSFSFELCEEEKSNSSFGEASTYIIEPLSGILKSGAFKSFGERFGLRKLAPNSHIYTSPEIPKDIPARVFEVIQEVQAKKADIKKLFPSGKVNVITRNYASGSEVLKKKIGVKDGGTDFLIGTKTPSGFKIFWCKLAI
jgi:predicted O-methyltransferase YrrM